jgi:hypothetical protein
MVARPPRRSALALARRTVFNSLSTVLDEAGGNPRAPVMAAIL